MAAIVDIHYHTTLSTHTLILSFFCPLPLFPSPLSLPLPYKHLFSTKKRSNPSSTNKTGGGGGAVVTGELEVVSWTDLSHCVLLTPTLVKERPYSSSVFGGSGATVNGNRPQTIHTTLLYPIMSLFECFLLSFVSHTLQLTHPTYVFLAFIALFWPPFLYLPLSLFTPLFPPPLLLLLLLLLSPQRAWGPRLSTMDTRSCW